jgi:hypothetical protein
MRSHGKGRERRERRSQDSREEAGVRTKGYLSAVSPCLPWGSHLLSVISQWVSVLLSALITGLHTTERQRQLWTA